MAALTVRDVLSRYSHYYRCLNAANQLRFEQRLADLLLVLEFCSANSNHDLPMETKIVIGSAQVQLTFGLERFLPERYDSVVVLPDAYRVTNFEQPLVGHVDPNTSKIYLSWKHVRHGFLIHDDAVNVALHEFAHWLDLENQLITQKLLCQAEYSDWRKHAAVKLVTVRNRKNRFLKNYSGKNMLEMFAVGVEAFFERSKDFKENLPELYDSLVELLNQDPTNPADPPILG